MRLLPLLPLFALLVGCQPIGTEDTAPTVVLPDPTGSGDRVLVQTLQGDIEIQLFLDEAPITTTNFLSYVEAGFYDGSDGAGAGSFYRPVPGFVLQGGGVTVDGAQKITQAAITNEAIDSGLLNTARTLAMARTSDPDSAAAEFFINLEDNANLDPDSANTNNPWGYAVFGEVVAGWDVVELIMAQPNANESFSQPVEFLVFERI